MNEKAMFETVAFVTDHFEHRVKQSRLILFITELIKAVKGNRRFVKLAKDLCCGNKYETTNIKTA